MVAGLSATLADAYGVASVVTLATGANEVERKFTQRKDELNKFMRQMRMPSALQQSLREYVSMPGRVGMVAGCHMLSVGCVLICVVLTTKDLSGLQVLHALPGSNDDIQ